MSVYQVKVLGTSFRLDALKDNLTDFPIDFVDGVIDTLYPRLYLYFAKSAGDKKYSGGENLADLVRQQVIIPIVKDVADCKTMVPDELMSINALVLNDEESIDKLKNYILRTFGLMDVNRKVFISYKRDDCEGLAQQLFIELSKRNFVPFLDSYIIEPGVDFQQYLMHELADSEVMIFINSKNYGSSQWCKEELANASNIAVPIIQLCFEEAENLPEADISKRVPMGKMSDKSCAYGAKMDEIMDAVENYRAQGYEIRRKTLVELLNDKYSDANFINVSNGMLYSDRKKVAVSLINRIPTTFDLQHAEERMHRVHEIEADYNRIVAFNGLYCRPDFADHQAWINNLNTPVKFFDVTQ